MRYTTLTEILKDRSRLNNTGITFIEKSSQERFLPYESLYQHSLKSLSFLQAKGLKPTDELVFQIEDNQTLITVFWACILGGIVPVPLSVGRNDEHKQKLFNVWKILSNPYLVISEHNLNGLYDFAKNKAIADTYSEIKRKTVYEMDVISSNNIGEVFCAKDNDIAFVQFSSGSTGIPKGVVLTHKNLIANMEAISRAANYSEEESMISWMPLTHDMGMIGFHINPLFSGMNQYIIPTDLFIRKPAIWLDKASEHKVNILCSPNFGYKYVVKHCAAIAHNWDLSCVRIIFNGAEPISQKLCDEFLTGLAQYGLNKRAMCPVYGLAEASLAVSISNLGDDVLSVGLDRRQLNSGDRIVEQAEGEMSVSFVNVGRAVANCFVRIADEHCAPLSDEVIGHVQVKGENVTEGYYNNPVATANSITNDGWLDTGDLGFLKDGALYITGRAKDIIFTNSKNFYAHDIERIAEEVDGIELNRIAVVGSFNNEKEEVIAFVLYRGDLEKFIPLTQAIKSVVNAKAELEIDKVIPVKDMPRTTSGKLQRFKLLEKYRDGFFAQVQDELATLHQAFNSNNLVEPENEKEEKLLQIWEDVLSFKNIGTNRKFFEIGGDSLKAAELAAKIQREFHVELTRTMLYRCQTVKELAAEINVLSHKLYEPIPTAIKAVSYPVSFSQKRLYYAWKVNPSSIAYNIPVAIRIKGMPDVERLKECLYKLVLQHDSLRMIFHQDVPEFTVSDDIDVRLDCTTCEKSDWDEQLKGLIGPFDLTQGPLFRFFLLKQDDENESLLFLDFHHIISDGQSVYWFIEQLIQLYNGEELPGGVSYRDFVTWQREYYSNNKEIVKKYWLDLFYDGVPVLELPADFPRPVVLNTQGKRKEFLLDKKLVIALNRISQAAGVTTHTLFFTLYNILLSKYAGQEDIIIGIPVLGRKHPDLQQTQGMFVNNLAIRNILSGTSTFIDTVKYAAQILNEAYDHQDIAFDDLVNLLDIPLQPGRNPLFDTMFLYQNLGINDRQLSDLEVSRYYFDPGFSKFDISMEVLEDKDGTKYAFEYANALFSDETILRLSEGFERIVEKVIEDPEAKVVDLSPLSNEEFDEFTVNFNVADERAWPFETVLEYFDEQVRSTPNAIALMAGEETITYEELNEQANKIAYALVNKGIHKGDLIGLRLTNSPQLIISIFGVLKAGAAYLPIDLDMPGERLNFILSDSQCKYIITEESLSYPGIDIEPEIIEIGELLNGSEEIPLPIICPADLAYVIYTSGTSGKPKGVMIEQSSLVNYILWAADQYVGKEQYSFALYSSISFDLTVTSIFVPLLTGNQLVIYEEDYSETLIEKVIRDNRVDVVKLTPSHLRLLCSNHLLSSECKVKRFIVGGENLDMNLANRVYEIMNGEVEIFNEYGPTEATVGCMIYKFNPKDTLANVPIGKPIANTQIYLLDKYLHPVPLNANGEIYISGSGLARGYLFREDLTTEKFIANPYVKGERLYKTGDLAKRLPDGNLVFIGRNDQLVKINGYRIELSEIEHELMSSGYVDHVAVILDVTCSGINAYYTSPESGSKPDEMDMRNYLAERLPHYMIPGKFIQVASMPLTRNGKVNIDGLQNIKVLNDQAIDEIPQNEIERILIEVWEEVLNTNEVGVNDNFFELGGDSIKAVQISSRLFEKGISVKVKDILTYHRIKHISQYAEPVGNQQKHEQGIWEGTFMPTPIQSWFLSRQFRSPGYYNQSALFMINDELNIPLLQRTFEELIKHHDTLRINIDQDNYSLFYNNEHLRQKIIIQEFEIDEENNLESTCNEIRGSFDISKSLLIKAAIIKIRDAAYLFISAHHLIVDGISWRILMEDFQRAYLLLRNGGKVKFPAKTASFKDWSRLLYQLSKTGEFEKEAAYWNEIEETSFTIPQDIETKDWLVENMGTVSASLDKENTGFLLKDAHKVYNSDALILLNTALALALKEWSGYEKFVIELENHGRHLEIINTSRTIGWFTAMYPFKLALAPYQPIGYQIKKIKEDIRNVPNQGFGYGIYKYISGTDKKINRNTLSEIRLNYLGQFDKELNNDLLVFINKPTGRDCAPENVMTTKLELNLMVVSDELHLEINYNRKAHKESTIKNFRDSFLKSLKNILDDIRGEEHIYFTPSDFNTVDLDQEELDILFD